MAILQAWGSIFYFISSERCLKRKSVLTFENCFNLKGVIVTHKKAVICAVVTHMWMDNRDLKDDNSHSTSIHFSVDAEGLKKKRGSIIRVMLLF